MYNVVLVLDVKPSDSVIHLCVFFFRFFPTLGYYKMLSIVPCAMQ